MTGRPTRLDVVGVHRVAGGTAINGGIGGPPQTIIGILVVVVPGLAVTSLGVDRSVQQLSAEP